MVADGLGGVFVSAGLAALAAAAIGGGLAWRRAELDLAPGATAFQSGLAGAGAGALLEAFGAGGEALILFAALAPLSVIDARRLILPNEATLTLIALGLALGVLAGPEEALSRALGAALGYGVLRGLGAVWFRWRGVEAMGLGDAKLLAGIGAFLGWRALPEMAFIAALVGVVAALARGKTRESETPFGPALALGALIQHLGRTILT